MKDMDGQQRGQEETLETCKEIIKEAKYIVFFGGAGVSTASGIPDFRSATGLYNRQNDSGYTPEYMLSHNFLIDNPAGFSNYIRHNLVYPDAKPNAAHMALVTLEKRGQLDAIVTQNIDGLHQLAGNTCVLEIHGNLRDYYCSKCNQSYPMQEFMEKEGAVTCPECGGIIRPDVTLYGEQLPQETLYKAVEAIHKADVLIVGGTSLVVYPAAGLLQYYNGHKMILINREQTPSDNQADYVIHGDIARVLPEIVA